LLAAVLALVVTLERGREIETGLALLLTI